MEDNEDLGLERKAKILLYDLEVSPLRTWTYGLWQTNVVKLEDRQRLMSVSWQWYDPQNPEGEIFCETLYMQDTYNVDKHNDFLLVKKLYDLMNEADICIAHNGAQFDNKVANMLFAAYRMTPVSPYKTVDTRQVAKRYFRFPSNSLQNLAEFFQIGGKSAIRHSDIWYQCFELGDPECWELMVEYNNQDVVLLRKIYEILRPYITNHPNIARIQNTPSVCPKCGALDKWESAGWRTTNVQRYRRYRCGGCGGYAPRRKAVPADQDVKPEFINSPT